MRKLICIAAVLALLTSAASAHPGQTDSQGGHYDHSTGEYHFHHGYPAHQHTDGVCPYDFDDRTGMNSGSPGNSGAYSSADIPDDYSRGYYDGMTAAKTEEYMNSSDSYDDAYDYGYNAGLESGYETGYEDGLQTARAEEYNSAREKGYDEGYQEGASSASSAKFEQYQQHISRIRTFSAYIILILAGAALILICQCVSLSKKAKSHSKQLSTNAVNYKRNYDTLYAKYLSCLETSKSAQAALEQKLSRCQSQLQARPAPPKPVPPAAPRLSTFGRWASEVHRSEQAAKRYSRSLDPRLELIGMKHNFYQIKGTSGIYAVTLNSCSCADFNTNLHHAAPCKHIYFLAHCCGLPISEIFTIL